MKWRLDLHGHVVARFAPQGLNGLTVGNGAPTERPAASGYDGDGSAQKRESAVHYYGGREHIERRIVTSQHALPRGTCGRNWRCLTPRIASSRRSGAGLLAHSQGVGGAKQHVRIEVAIAPVPLRRCAAAGRRSLSDGRLARHKIRPASVRRNGPERPLSR
jgi:hypothetical protein